MTPKLLPAFFISVLLLSTTDAAIKLSRVFTDHAVLQRNQAVAIWGSADANEKISLQFRDQTHQTVANAKGDWRITLTPMKAGGPDDMSINKVVLKDVLVGDVWLGSGQSNMAGTAKGYARKDEFLREMVAGGPYPKVRLLGSRWHGWTISDQENAERFSALLFAYGLELNKELDVPIGLMVGAVGGTPSGRWIAKDMLMRDEACRQQYELNTAATTLEEKLRRYEAKKAAMEKAGKDTKRLRKPVASPPFDELKPGSLFESHLRQFVGYGIRGVLWDQGESGTMFPEIEQDTMMRALIAGWRKDWGQGDFPWIYIQKPSGGGCAWEDGAKGAKKFQAQLPADANPKASENGVYRSRFQRIAEQNAQTYLATTTDLGTGVHPVYKSTYGARAAKVAFQFVYDLEVLGTGPTYRGHTVKKNRVHVSFDHVGDGLVARHQEAVQGFAIAGSDQVFHWAEAKVDGDRIILQHPAVPEPIAVRYAWWKDAPWANLFNQQGLPAMPFRSDNW